MRAFSVIPYFGSMLLFYLSIYIAEGSHFNIWSVFDPSTFLCLIAGIIMTMANFNLSEIIKVIKNSFSNKMIETEILVYNRKILSDLWKNIFNSFGIISILSLIIALANADTAKLGPYISILIICSFYLISLKLFIFMPLDTSLQKKLAQKKKL